MLKNKVLFLIFMILCLQSFADDLDDFLEDADIKKVNALNINSINEFDSSGAHIDFKTIDELRKKEEEFEQLKYRRAKVNYTRKQKKIASIPFIAIIKRNTKLIHLKSGKEFIVPKPIYVKAIEKFPGSQTTYLYVKGKKEPLYQTFSWNLSSVENDIKLLPSIDSLTVYEEKRSFNTENINLQLQSFLKLNLESMNTPYLQTLFQGTETAASSTSLQIKNYYLTEAPFHFGLELLYNQGYWTDQAIGTLIWRSLFIGPTVHINFWNTQESSWHFHLAVSRSLRHKSEKGIDSHKYSSTTLSLELERAMHTSLGKFLLGGSLRWGRSSVKSTSELVINDGVKKSSQAMGITLGYLYDWSL